jgi:hypothetical protein
MCTFWYPKSTQVYPNLPKFTQVYLLVTKVDLLVTQVYLLVINVYLLASQIYPDLPRST